MIRALFYRGRHHHRTAPRDAGGDLLTVAAIAGRIRREAYGSARVTVWPDFRGFADELRRVLVGAA